MIDNSSDNSENSEEHDVDHDDSFGDSGCGFSHHLYRFWNFIKVFAFLI